MSPLNTGGANKARWIILAIALIIALAIVVGVLVPLLEFLIGVVVPMAGCAVLAWFGYKLLLQPVLRKRKLDRIREHRASRAAAHADDDGQG